MPNPLRTFIAVEVSPEVRRRAGELIDALRPAGADIRWVTPESMHLTLKFLGDVPEENIAKVADAIRQAAEKFTPFELEVRGAGAFPTVNRPRSVWIGGGAGDAEMTKLAAALDKALKPLGFAKENRPFSTHLTIGRLRNPSPKLRDLSDLLRAHADFAAGRIAVNEIVLFSSDLKPTGPIYAALAHLPLAGQ